MSLQNLKYKPQQPVLIEFTNGWRKGSFVRYVAGDMDEDFERIIVFHKGRTIGPCHPDCIKPLCVFKGCKNEAKGYHCKSCDAVVCAEHQEPSGYGNHGGLTGEINIGENTDWQRIGSES